MTETILLIGLVLLLLSALPPLPRLKPVQDGAEVVFSRRNETQTHFAGNCGNLPTKDGW